MIFLFSINQEISDIHGNYYRVPRTLEIDVYADKFYSCS